MSQIEVGMGKYGSASGSQSLHTDGLATCIRIAVAGTYTNGSNGRDRFLAHIAEDEDETDGTYQGLRDFFASIKTAQANHFKIDKVVVVLGDLTMESGYNSENERSRKNAEEQNDFNNEAVYEIRELVGFTKKVVNVAPHDPSEHYEMLITESKEILFKCEDDEDYEDFDAWYEKQSEGEGEEEES
jgi:hypothetical protein